MKHWASKHPRLLFAMAGALLLHTIFFWVIVTQKPTPIPVIAQTQVVVRTVQLKPPPPPKAVVAAPAPVKKAPPVKKPAPPTKKTASKKPAAKKAPEKVAKKAPPPPPKKERFADAKKILQEMNKPAKEATPKAPDLSPEQAAYTTELVAHLRLMLQLPNFGDVDLELTLSPDGTVASVRVIKALHSGNRTYIESKLPTLQLPPYGKLFGRESHHTFLLNLQNE